MTPLQKLAARKLRIELYNARKQTGTVGNRQFAFYSGSPSTPPSFLIQSVFGQEDGPLDKILNGVSKD